MIPNKYDERFTSAADEDAWNDGTASSEIGPMFLFGTAARFEYPAEAIKRRESCRHCGGESANRFTTYCQIHQELHEMRMLVHAGNLSQDDYEKWFQANKHRIT